MKNKMKKFLFFGALAALLLGTASCSNEMEPEMSDGTVQFKVELPGNIDSRAIADGTTATKLDVACYDADGNFIEPTITITPFNERVATVTVKLVKGQKYNFAFFAHADGAPYTFTPGANMNACKFDVDYTGTCNAENRDAFYAVLKNYEVTSATTEVRLYRPFAQLNFGTDDLAAAKAAGINPIQSKVKVSKAASTFSLFSGETSNDVENIEYTLADLPDATTVEGVMTPATLTVENKDYAWMEMCYFLVPDNEANVNVEMTVTTKDNNDVARADVVVPVTSVPVKKNHRTNILGSLFTQEGNFRVVIIPDFDADDYNIAYPEVTDVVYGTDGTEYSLPSEAILADKAKGVNDIVITLAKGTYTDVLCNNNLGTFNSLTIKAAEGVAPEDVVIDGQCFFSSRNVTMKGITLTNANAPGLAAIEDQYGGNGGGFQTQKTLVLIWTSGTYNFENCIFDNVSPDASGIYTYWLTEQTTVNAKNCTFKGSGTLQRAIQIYGETTSRIENCTFTDVYRYCACIHGGSNDIEWINNTVLGDGLYPGKKCNAIEHGSKTYARGADDPQDLIYVEGGNYPATGDSFVPYTIAYDEQPILSGTMPDGSAAIWQ